MYYGIEKNPQVENHGYAEVEEFIGKKIHYTTDEIPGLDNIFRIVFDDGSVLTFCHDKECCEQVYLEDICGSWGDVIGEEIILFEKRSSTEEDSDCEKWTFYEIRTINGSLTLRFLGESNGYYSLDVYTTKGKIIESFSI